MSIVITGSIAFDYLMSFPGQVHRALPARTHEPHQPQLSRRHDGQAARRLRAEHRVHAGAAWRTAAADGGGRRGLRRISALARSGRRRHVARRADSGEVHRVVLLQHRPGQQPDCVVLHRRDGGRRRAVLPRRSEDCGLAIISPNDPDAMVQYAEECRTLGIPYIFDPGQQCARMSGEELRAGLVGATW